MVHPSSDHLIKRYFEKVTNPVTKLSSKPKDKYTRAVSKHSMKHVQSSGMLSLQMNDLSAFVSQNTVGRKKSRDFIQRKRTTSQVILPDDDNRSSFLSHSYLADKTSDNNSFDDDEVVN